MIIILNDTQYVKHLKKFVYSNFVLKIKLMTFVLKPHKKLSYIHLALIPNFTHIDKN